MSKQELPKSFLSLLATSFFTLCSLNITAPSLSQVEENLTNTTISLQTEDELSNKLQEVEQQARDLSLAQELVQYGNEHNNPLALVNAAQILTKLSIRELNIDSSNPLTAKELLEEAKKIAQVQRNELLVNMIDNMEGIKGSSIGSITATFLILESFDYYDFDREFLANQQAQFTAVADANTEIECQVFDSNDFSVQVDFKNKNMCELEWSPKKTSKFTILVSNKTKAKTPIKMWHN